MDKAANNLFGIYIPTRNRAKELEVCLNSFIPQLKPYGFPIFIADNDSQDGTKALITRLKKKYPNIVYKDFGKSTGFPTAYVNLLKMGHTEYAWVFSDDDAIKKGSIDVIVENLRMNYDFLLINLAYYDKNLSSQDKSHSMDRGEDTVYAKGEHSKVFLSTVKYTSWSLLSNMIIRKKRFDAHINDFPRDMFLSIVLPYRAIVGGCGKYISSPMIKYRTDNVSWQDRMIKIAIVEAPKAFRLLSPWYSKETLRKATAYDIKKLVAIVNAQKKYDPKKTSLYIEYVRESELDYPSKLVALAVLTLPQPVVDFTINAVKKVSK
jgi:glycosyltransferase involved in cell wall biosynthesis